MVGGLYRGKIKDIHYPTDKEEADKVVQTVLLPRGKRHFHSMKELLSFHFPCKCVHLRMFQMDLKTQKVWFKTATTQSLHNSEFSDSQSSFVSLSQKSSYLLKEHPYFELTSSL